MLAGGLSERLSGLHFTQDLELEFFGKLTTSECHNGSFRKGYHSLTHCLILGVHSNVQARNTALYIFRTLFLKEIKPDDETVIDRRMRVDHVKKFRYEHKLQAFFTL